MLKQVYEINIKGFIINPHVAKFKDGIPIEKLPDNFITTDLPQPLLFYKPKWNGNEWIEGATQEEIDELTKVEPSPPTDMELLKEELTNTNSMLLEIMELLIGGN